MATQIVALLDACTSAQTLRNTGSDCNAKMGVIKKIAFVPPNAKWTAANEADFLNYSTSMAHAPASVRWYFAFGNLIPIRDMKNDKTANIYKSYPDGSKDKVLDGIVGFTLTATGGGLCFASALYQLSAAKYSVILIDVNDQVLRILNTDGTFSGIPTLLIDSIPTQGDFAEPGAVDMMLEFKQADYFRRTKIVQANAPLDQLNGLVDIDILPTGTPSITTISVLVKSDCGATDLGMGYGTALSVAGNFVIANQATGAVVTPSTVASVGNTIVFTGSFTSGQKYVVTGAAASVWLAASIVGFEAIKPAIISIP